MTSSIRQLAALMTALAWLVTPALHAADTTPPAPRVFSLDAGRVVEGRRRVRENLPEVRLAVQELRREADRALQAGPFSVMNKTLTPASGDKHDYVSFGPYWWPDPDKPDGLPYIRRDGKVNPGSRTTASDRPALGAMSGAVETLALAYYFTGEERYAEHAGKLLRTWFLADATRMNPHLRFGQAIPGRTEGRGIGIIDTRQMPAIVDAVGLLAPFPSWTDVDRQGMVHWMDRYLDWLLTSPLGIDEDNTKNNHATYYDVQVVSLALFVNKPDIARRVVEAAGTRRVVAQIEPDGRQPLELARTRSFDYSVMNLAGMYELATLARHVGVNLWQPGTMAAARLRAALDYLLQHSESAQRWPHEQITPFDRGKLRPLLWRAAILSPDPQLETAIERLADNAAAADRYQLLWPRP